MQNTTTQWRRATQFLEKYTSHFIWKGCVWEGVGDRTELQHIDPHSNAHNRVSFPFTCASQLGAWGPTLLGASFLYHILSPTGLVCKLTDFLSSPSYIIVKSPTHYLPITGHRDESLPLSLEWHVWFSSSRNNCHAVHRSLSSCASVWLYRGIFPCPILSSKPAYVSRICNFHVFGMACLAGSKVIIQHIHPQQKKKKKKREGKRVFFTRVYRTHKPHFQQ